MHADCCSKTSGLCGREIVDLMCSRRNLEDTNLLVVGDLERTSHHAM